MADDSVKLKLDIEIDGECYALDKIPSAKSGVVRAETEKLLGTIDLNSLVTDLRRVGDFIRIAYNAVGAAGYQLTDEQIEVQRLGYGITELCDKSAITVSKFKEASSSILTDLQCTYEYLLNNKEMLALVTLSSVSELAEKMKKAALELHDDFEAEEKKVVATLENTQKAKQIQASKIEEEKRRRIELEGAIKHEKELIKEYQEKEREAEDRRRHLERKEDKAISKIGSITIKSLINAVTTMYARINVFDTADDNEIKAEKFRQSRLEALEVEQAIRKKRLEALANMSAFTVKIKLCSNDQEMAEYAVDALHEASGALKKLSFVMMQTALFWEQMQEHCNSLADSRIKSQVKTAIEEYCKEERQEVWTSKPFKRRAIQFYSGWVALNNVCTVYMEKIKETQRDLYKYITENPTYEESKRILPDLAEKFNTDLKRDQKAIEEKEFKAQEEILALTQAKE